MLCWMVSQFKVTTGWGGALGARGTGTPLTKPLAALLRHAAGKCRFPPPVGIFSLAWLLSAASASLMPNLIQDRSKTCS